MKLLLTSNGLSNESIVKALFDLVGKKPEDTKIVFIPTAMNPGGGDKSWFVNDLKNIERQDFKELDIVDISALPENIWRPRMEDADVLFFSGGNTMHLMKWIIQSGLRDILSEWMKTKVWVGASAGGMVTNPTLALSSKDKKIYYEENFGYASEEALGFVNFYVRPHLNSPDFPQATKEYIGEVAKDIKEVIYGLDDESAIKVDGDKIEVISEGDWVVFNQK